MCSKEPLEYNEICRICEVWGDQQNLHRCDQCRNAYHDACLDDEFRGRVLDKCWSTCTHLGIDCNFTDGPIFRFKFGGEINRVLNGSPERVYYDGCDYLDTTYKIGDDVILSMAGDNTEVGRISKIFKDDDNNMAYLKVSWFWKPSAVNEKYEDEDRHELYFDPELESEEPWEAILGKATVVDRYDEYLRQKKESNLNVYWCTHAYHSKTKKKDLMPVHGLPTHISSNTTPVSSTRKRDRKQIIIDDLEDANRALMSAAIPTQLLCREKEHEEIRTFMKCAIENGGMGSGLYISGMPGTGKTATVRQIARELKQTKLPPFVFHEINAMKLQSPHQLYIELCKYVLNKQFSPSTAAQQLELYFSTEAKDKKLIVLLVDELDYLLTKRQKVIYNVFDWPTRAHSKFVVIGIANTMDLPERLLPRVSSRLGLTRIVFTSYSREQLVKIVRHRLGDTNVFSHDAIKYCASSVASITGDCRVLFQICRRAIEIVIQLLQKNGLINNDVDNKKRSRMINVSKNKTNPNNFSQNQVFQISVQHIKMAKAAFDQSNDIQTVSTCAIYEKLFLTAMVMHHSHTGVIAATKNEYRRKFNSFSETQLGASKMENVHFQNMLNRLQDIGLIKIVFNKTQWVQWIKFNVQVDDAKHALKQNEICAKIISNL